MVVGEVARVVRLVVVAAPLPVVAPVVVELESSPPPPPKIPPMSSISLGVDGSLLASSARLQA